MHRSPGLRWLGLTLLTLILLPAAASGAGVPLDLDGRAACRAAVEEVYWRHRTWPGPNPAAKPAFSEGMPEAALRREAERTVLLSNVLEQTWHHPVGVAELRGELERIFRDSRDPKRLQEIAAALGGDGYRLAECLARPRLVERLARSFFSEDARFQTESSFDAWLASVELGLGRALTTDPAAWASWTPPAASLGGDVGEWSPTANLPEASQRQTAVWTGTEMIIWGGGTDTGSRYDPATDTWTPTAIIGAASPRSEHSAVWTGTEMIIWGGCGQGGSFCDLGTGARYNPATDSWAPVAPAPIVIRQRHTAVWTGTEMIIWGGCRTGSLGNNNCEIELGEGGRYDPATDSWRTVSTAGQPAPRKYHTAVWSGREMIVWGGHIGISTTNAGGRYDPVTDTWASTTLTAAPAPRSNHTAVWTGTEMIVWGGCDNSTCTGTTTPRFGDGGRYDPVLDRWVPVPTTGAPDPRAEHTAVWTGTEMIVWGGEGQDNLPRNTGGRYDPALDIWRPTSTAGAPSARTEHRAVWTGREMVIWGRRDPQGRKTGGRYNPATDTWRPTSLNDPRHERIDHAAVWTGSEMLIWGGDQGGSPSGLGDRYDPATDTWTPMSDTGEPSNRRNGLAAVWTGLEMVIWGGDGARTGGRYNPATNTWRPTSTVNAPEGRSYHAMVWTGTRVFVWGGNTNSSLVSATGGLYDPVGDTWTSTNLAGAPEPRYLVDAVWTGSRVLVWGGMGSAGDLGTGGAYDPATDTWSPITTAGAPAPRHFHTLLWTGSRMIVWGGSEGFIDEAVYFNSGGLYDPATDTWTPTTLTGAPSARMWHSSVWTGEEMIVWGGCNGGNNCGTRLFTGALYDPALDQWTDTPLQSAPGARDSHSAVWTGSSMIVWGGRSGTTRAYTLTGAVYSPRSKHLFSDGFESSDTSAWDGE